MTEEVWKEIEGYEGLYWISNKGNVKNKHNRLISNGRIKKSRGNWFGYIKFALNKNCQQKQFYAHKLVAKAFIENPDNKPQVDHIDGNSLNNNVENLAWVTQAENNDNPICKQRCLETRRKNQKPFVVNTLTGKTYSLWVDVASDMGVEKNEAIQLIKKYGSYRGFTRIVEGG